MTSDSISIYIAGAASGMYLITTLFLGLELLFDVFRQKHQPATPLMQVGGATMLCDFFAVLTGNFIAQFSNNYFWYLISHVLDGLVAALFCLIGFTLIKGKHVSEKLASIVVYPTFAICLLACIIPIEWSKATIIVHGYLAIFYIHLGWKILKHDKSLKDYYSNIENRTSKWFITFLAWFFMNMPLYYFINVNHLLGNYSQAIYNVAVTLLYLLMTQQMFRQARLYVYGKEYYDVEQDTSEEEEANVALLSPATQAKIEEGLHQLMDIDKMYLQPELTLKEVCAALHTNNTYLYYYMHDVQHKRFFQYINDYRIEEAKRRLLEDSDEKIEAIAFSCGFSTYSTFFTTFRNITGMTPSKWRQQKPDQS